MFAVSAFCCLLSMMLLPQGQTETIIHSQKNLQLNGLLYPQGSTVLAILNPSEGLPRLASNVDVNVFIDCSPVVEAVTSAINTTTPPTITWTKLYPTHTMTLSSASVLRLGIRIQGENKQYLNITHTVLSTGAREGVAGTYSCKACIENTCESSSVQVSVVDGLPSIEEGNTDDMGTESIFSVDFRIGTDTVCISENPSHASGVQVNMNQVHPTEPEVMGIGLVCHQSNPEVDATTMWMYNGTEIVNRGTIIPHTPLCTTAYDESCKIYVVDEDYIELGFITRENMHEFIGTYTCMKYQLQTDFTVSSSTSILSCVDPSAA